MVQRIGRRQRPRISRWIDRHVDAEFAWPLVMILLMLAAWLFGWI